MCRRRIECVAGTTILVLHLLSASSASCQEATEAVWAIGDDRVRVVFPVSVPDSGLAQVVLAAARSSRTIRGLPAGSLGEGRISVVVGSSFPSALDAVASTRGRTVILPLDRLGAWSTEKLQRVLRHEFAHIALGSHLGLSRQPIWFSEGYSEWAAGGLTCEGHVRISVALMERDAGDANRWPSLSPDRRERLAYDLFTTFFEYLEMRRPGVVEGGKLILALKEQELNEVLSSLMGAGLAELEGGWRSWVRARFRSAPPLSLRCGSDLPMS